MCYVTRFIWAVVAVAATSFIIGRQIGMIIAFTLATSIVW